VIAALDRLIEIVKVVLGKERKELAAVLRKAWP